MGRRALVRAIATLAAAILGAALLSGSDQPVTAHPYPRWQELAAPPISPRTDALGVRVGHRVLVLGGRAADGSALRDGAAYDVSTGSWHRIVLPVPLSERDRAVAAAGVAIVRQDRPGRGAAWWRYDPRRDRWSQLRSVPAHASAPSVFGSEVYALSGPRVVVYSVQLDRWTPLPADPIRPALTGRRVSASRAGTVVTGDAGTRRLEDRWDGLRWRRSRATSVPVVTAAPDGSTRVRIGGALLMVKGAHAWMRLPS